MIEDTSRAVRNSVACAKVVGFRRRRNFALSAAAQFERAEAKEGLNIIETVVAGLGAESQVRTFPVSMGNETFMKH